MLRYLQRVGGQKLLTFVLPFFVVRLSFYLACNSNTSSARSTRGRGLPKRRRRASCVKVPHRGKLAESHGSRLDDGEGVSLGLRNARGEEGMTVEDGGGVFGWVSRRSPEASIPVKKSKH